MMLDELIHNIPVKNVRGSLGVSVTGMTQDSRRVRPGDLFVAVSGHEKDGHDFIADAVKRGAVGIVGSREDISVAVPYVVVENIRETLAKLAARFYGEPTRHMRVIGVTGTNGKTSTTYLLESILREAGRKPAVLGTINCRYEGKVFPSMNTTPESVELQKLFSEFLQAGATDVVMEVSSHALSLGRVDGVHFDAAVFTNLTQDHLDFHGDMTSYFEAKQKLFTTYLTASAKKEKFSVINMEDQSGEVLFGKSEGILVRTGLTGPYEVSCRSYEVSEKGIHAVVQLGSEVAEISSPLLGQFNLENILGAMGAAMSLGIPTDAIVRGVEKMLAVPGRLERIANTCGLHVFVDYAHTPDALARVGANLKKFARGKIITVFGCGGDRDRTKRPLMGHEAALFSDRVVLTSDNPRTENPEVILDQIEPGLKTVGLAEENIFRITSRAEALKKAVELASPGDFILVAGKGHEDYQIVGTQKSHFSDQETLRDILDKKKKGQS